MPTCPLCLHDNQETASVCEHCGRFRFSEDAPPDNSDAHTLTETRFRGMLADSQAAGLPPLPELPTSAASLRLQVIRGQKLGSEFPLYDGDNFLGRSGDQPADIDLTGLEPPDQVWSSRQHAVIHRNGDQLSVEDLHSLNGTFLNRAKLFAGKKHVLKHGDVIQIGTVQFRVLAD